MEAKREKIPFWSDTQAQQQVVDKLKNILQESEAWWILLLSPSCYMMVSDALRTETKNLWGYTDEKYGETVAEPLAPEGNSNIRFCRGLVFHILRQHPQLRKEVLKALMREALDNVSLEEQNLYKTLVD